MFPSYHLGEAHNMAAQTNDPKLDGLNWEKLSLQHSGG